MGIDRARGGPRRGLIALSLTATMAMVLAACSSGGSDDADGDGRSGPADDLELSIEIGEDGSLVVNGPDGPVLETAASSDGAPAPLAWRTAEHSAEAKGDVYLGHELLATESTDDAPWTTVTAAETSADGDTVTASLTSGDGTATLSAEPAGDGIVRITFTAPADATEVAASFACGADEQFRGFGAQTWATEHRGETVPIWVVEQGIGKVTPEDPGTSLAGEPYDSYIPVPWFFSSEGYGVSLDSLRYATFDLCTEDDPEAWTLTTWDRTMSWYVLVGDTPRDLVERYTAIAGRPLRAPPDWFYAPMNDAVRGEANVRRVAELIRANDIPSSVIWTEDWIGLGSASTGFRLSHDWDVSTGDYPDMRALTDDLHDDGYRFLGYFSPFIPDSATTPGGPATLPSGDQIELFPQNEPKWTEANEGRFWFTDPDGEPYLMVTPPFTGTGAGLDLTDEQAIDWYQGYVERAEALGLDGSMTDFGEWVPFDAQFADGRDGAEFHNEYPLRWQEANREIWEELRPDGDYLFYVRSGTTGTGRLAPAVWGGDQNTSFDRLDGLGSVITMGTNLGLSGVAFYGHDIAGYSGFPGLDDIPTTSKELFLRWAAIGAYTPMMRTHHGSLYGQNWSFEGGPNPDNLAEPIADPETLAAWKRLAIEHITLFPYLQVLGEEAVETGLPIMRDPILVEPDDPAFAGDLPDDEALVAFTSAARPEGELFEYFLGDDLLVAPVIDEGATERPVYLPDGEWIEIHTGTRHEGPTVITAAAAPGEIPVYARAGAVVPRLPDTVETLAPTDDPEVVDHTDVADQLVVDVYAGADGSFTLADGTTIALEGDATGALVAAEVDGTELDVADGPVEASQVVVTGESVDHTVELRTEDGQVRVQVTGGIDPRTITIRYHG